ncbi:ATP-binding protein [Winogradskyella maritima]|uniref:histidine kinase n=1 Tax=Winogradskyella maritima TaxID=1517766 RepID=A0ABV8AFU4_9FLAO|nr:ATP-binding protein [Winogradskyella maritima]
MKLNLLLIACYFILNFTYAQDERSVIKTIDLLNQSAKKAYLEDNIDLAFEAITRAIHLSDSISDYYGTAISYITLGNIYAEIGDYHNADSMYQTALESAKSVEDPHTLSKANLYIGLIALKQNKKASQIIKPLEEAMRVAQSIPKDDEEGTLEKNSIMAKALVALASYHNQNEQSTASLALVLKAKNLLKTNLDFYDRALVNFEFGRYHFNNQNYFTAIDNFEIALSELKQVGKPSYQELMLEADITKNYANALKNLERKEEAYEKLVVAESLAATVFNEEKLRQVNLAKSQFNIESYKRKADIANQQRLLQAEVNEKKGKAILVVVVAACILAITLILVVLSQMSYRRIAKQLSLKNKELELAKNLAEESSKQKSLFISNISHELRTPLYGVVGLTSLLLESNNLDRREQGFLKSLKFSGDYLLHLINDVLQMSKIESNKVELQNTSFSPKRLAKNIYNSFSYQLEGKNNQLHLTLDRRLPKYILGDSVRLSQILINLVGNGLKFTNGGNVWLRMTQVGSSETTTTIQFCIEDDGPGIAPEEQKKIFETFSQLNRNYNSEYQGTGLGLSITKNLLEIFDSQINLESEIGKGSKFTFNISFEIDQAKQEALNIQTISQIISDKSNSRILIAEDNKINQIVTRNILVKENYDCDLVENGQLAVEAVKTKHYDLVLMDLNMPVMGGDEATQKIREFNKDIPIVALTASVMEEIKDRLMTIGMTDIIIKPYDNYEFFQTITKHLYKALPSETSRLKLSANG